MVAGGLRFWGGSHGGLVGVRLWSGRLESGMEWKRQSDEPGKQMRNDVRVKNTSSSHVASRVSASAFGEMADHSEISDPKGESLMEKIAQLKHDSSSSDSAFVPRNPHPPPQAQLWHFRFF
ncbi:hypothetical protein RHSIM_Rhsim01G0167500 [Rhododendron simsii]|uniref:Uncharacterized protein n=1 Tax=Rhododendron simsii TaxID=118357 RepID=A0A834HJ25_RHOSS|nr:hypothetical protein RHSIM_Rhsim01G0167500 [Rhododendron simsii]